MAWSKLSRQERGYGPEWDKVRPVILARDNNLCQACLKRGEYTPANIVDHVMSKANAKRAGWSEAKTEHPNNLQVICRPCHDIKSEEEQGKKKRVRKVPGPDGWPV